MVGDMPDSLDIGESAQKLIDRLGIRSNLLHTLNDEDDWSFIIKTHALVEAALTRFVVAGIRVPALEKTLSRMTIRGLTSKLGFAQALGASAQVVQFIDELTLLRNSIVHDVRNIDFLFADWIQSAKSDGTLDGKLRKLLGPLYDAPTSGGPMQDVFDTTPKTLLLFVAMFAIAQFEFCVANPTFDKMPEYHASFRADEASPSPSQKPDGDS